MNQTQSPPLSKTPRDQPGERSLNGDQALSQAVSAVALTPAETSPTAQASRPMGRRSLRTKVTAIVVAIGTVPVLLTGVASYFLQRQTVDSSAIALQQSSASDVAEAVSQFIEERSADLTLLAENPILTDPGLRETRGSVADRAQILQEFVENKTDFGGIALVTPQAQLSAHYLAPGLTPEIIQQLDWFQEILVTQQVAWSQPRPSQDEAGVFSVVGAAPVFDQDSNELIFMVAARIDVSTLEQQIGSRAENTDAFAVIDTNQQAFTSNNTANLGQGWLQRYPDLSTAMTSSDGVDLFTNEFGQDLVAFADVEFPEDLPDLGWRTVVFTAAPKAFAATRQLLLTVSLGTGITAVGVALLTALIANRAIRPLLTLTTAVDRIGQGQLDTRIQVKGEDEIAQLGTNINRMVGQIKALLQRQQQDSQQQIQIQTELTQQQEANAQQQQAAKEALQQRALELLQEVSPLRRGDLTIRANVTEDEIGTIADSYNATIGSLRKIVLQVQEAAQQLSTTTGSNETGIRDLAGEALQQAQSIQEILNQIEEMSRSIESVAHNAQEAEQVMQQANQVVLKGDQAMDHTVVEIQTMRETIIEAARKVKQLGVSSQEISQVVTLISEFTAQTNLLALNASMVAARAGRGGEAFAVISEEIRALATQSAQATTDIETFVSRIQSETQQVVHEMELGTEQVVRGSQLVEETRQSLSQITEASEQITRLVQSIASATVSQSKNSAVVAATITDVADISTYTSQRASQVLGAFQELIQLAQDLETTVGQFKLS